MKQFTSLDQWIALSMEERAIIMQKFNVVKSGGMEVTDGQVVSDGVTIRDLMIINVGSIIEYLGDKYMKEILEAFDVGVEHLFDKLWKVVLKVALKKEEPKKEEPKIEPEKVKEDNKEEKIFKN